MKICASDLVNFLLQKRLAIFVVSLFFALSCISNYDLISPFKVNFDIATMLTPIGILKNFLLSETYLTSFYHQVPESKGVLSNLIAIIILCLLEISTFLLLIKFKNK